MEQKIAEEKAEKKKRRSIALVTDSIVIILSVIREIDWEMNNALFCLLPKKYEWIGRLISK